MITKQQKKEQIEKIAKALKDSKSVVFANFHKLNVSDEWAMRKGLRKEGIGYMVVRKTLAKRALNEAGISGEMPEFVGELAIVYGEDLTGPAREFFTFQKKYKDSVKIVGGIFEGKYMNEVEMKGIAMIPSQQTLYAQFVNLINTPIQQLVVALDQIAKIQPVK